MAAVVPVPEIMEYDLDTNRLYKEVKHFNLTDGPQLFSNRLNIGINRGFSRANYDYSLKIWQGNKWSSQITGLFPTHDPEIFYGDTRSKRNLVIVRFMNGQKKLRLYFFQNFYTRRLTEFLKVFKENY
ncbi:hypothetical protein ACOKFD_16305 [Flagellimonas sp. S174]|uniref:hypothetical protein n=1 Tax=Flagellimonas sp. S174 TaxID=3410790 RepID=UPI003BF5196E